MTDDVKDVKKELAVARERFSREGVEVGLDLFDELLARHSDYRDKILRERSYAFSEFEMFGEALNDRQAIIGLGAGIVADYYFAGEYALQARLFKLSRDLFDQAIDKSLRSDSSYYLQSSRLLAALASHQLHEIDRCLDYLSRIDDDVEILWLKGFDRVSKKLMLDAIFSHRTKQGSD